MLEHVKGDGNKDDVIASKLALEPKYCLLLDVSSLHKGRLSLLPSVFGLDGVRTLEHSFSFGPIENDE